MSLVQGNGEVEKRRGKSCRVRVVCFVSRDKLADKVTDYTTGDYIRKPMFVVIDSGDSNSGGQRIYKDLQG